MHPQSGRNKTGRILAALLTFLAAFAGPLGGACVPVFVWLDGGFEATDSVTFLNPNYVVTSTNFGSPLCSQAHCGNGNNTALPRTGTYWAWFGGVAGATAETSSVAQAVTIPTGSVSATLYFYLWIGAVEAPFTDTLEVQVDGATQQTFTEPTTPETGYTLRSVNLTPFADGTAHTVKFLYTKPTGGGNANFSVDGVTVAIGCPSAQLITVPPCRVVDTRNATGPLGGPALAAGADRTFTFTGQCGIPSSAKAVALNVAVTQPSTGPGFLTLYPGGSSRPPTATINYSSGQTRANNAIISLGSAGDITVHCGQGSGTVQAIIDVNGYFQ